MACSGCSGAVERVLSKMAGAAREPRALRSPPLLACMRQRKGALAAASVREDPRKLRPVVLAPARRIAVCLRCPDVSTAEQGKHASMRRTRHHHAAPPPSPPLLQLPKAFNRMTSAWRSRQSRYGVTSHLRRCLRPSRRPARRQSWSSDGDWQRHSRHIGCRPHPAAHPPCWNIVRSIVRSVCRPWHGSALPLQRAQLLHTPLCSS